MKKTIPIMLMLIFIFSNVIASEKAERIEEIQMEKAETIFYDPPLPIALVGTKAGEQVNFMTVAWFTRLEVDPYLF